MSLFNPGKLDCSQWARAARSANMSYGCLTTKHHSGFCIWDTKTTDYNVMNRPLHRDVVKEYADAFRAAGLKVCLYYSILDTHHRLRPGFITRKQVEMIKAQLTELLTHYGEITALIVDGWDAPRSRISWYEVDLGGEKAMNTVVIRFGCCSTSLRRRRRLRSWGCIASGDKPEKRVNHK